MSVSEQRHSFVANKLGRYQETASRDPHAPTSYNAVGTVAEADRARVEAVNPLVWEELGDEGDVGSINTYDNPVLKDRLLDVGLAYDSGWLALDTANGVVLKRGAALEYVRFNTRVLSAMYALGQGAAAQGLVDTQARVMFTEFDAMPRAISDLDDRLMMVIVHCCWWGHMTLARAAELLKAGRSRTG